MILPTGTLPQVGDRITDKSAPPHDSAVREWIGPEAFEHWVAVVEPEGFFNTLEWRDAPVISESEPQWLLKQA